MPRGDGLSVIPRGSRALTGSPSYNERPGLGELPRDLEPRRALGPTTQSRASRSCHERIPPGLDGLSVLPRDPGPRWALRPTTGSRASTTGSRSCQEDTAGRDGFAVAQPRFRASTGSRSYHHNEGPGARRVHGRTTRVPSLARVTGGRSSWGHHLPILAGGRSSWGH
jgi:hypothetical protein